MQPLGATAPRSGRPGAARRVGNRPRSRGLSPAPGSLVALVVLACGPGHQEAAAIAWSRPMETPPLDDAAYLVPPPPFSEGVFPCSDCHDPELPVRTKRRTLRTAHQEIALHHDEENRWCLDCHAAEDRDQLHLASGELVPFERSYRLCGQCHGDKLRDWRAGVHGRRTGSWDGEKRYLLCVHCHDAHAPAFAPLVPEPVPHAPVRTP